MSRVDDDRDAARIAERLAQAKRAEEAKGKEKSAGASAFSKLVQGQKAAAQQAAGQKASAETQEAGQSTRDAIAQMLGQSDTKQADGARQGNASTLARQGAKTFDERLKGNAASEGDAAGRARETSDQGQLQTSAGRTADLGQGAARAESRGADTKANTERLEDRKDSSDSSAASRESSGASAAKGEKGPIKTDADKGGGGGKKDDKGADPSAAPGFRFNPALMAPVAVQKPNQTPSSDRLRKAATEIAQKIVERVRVGANAAGKMEFQIDLKSDVLGGMSVKVSSKNGKITAVFSGRDKDALKMLEEQSDSLKNALSSRGLTLESLKTEAKA